MYAASNANVSPPGLLSADLWRDFSKSVFEKRHGFLVNDGQPCDRLLSVFIPWNHFPFTRHALFAARGRSAELSLVWPCPPQRIQIPLVFYLSLWRRPSLLPRPLPSPFSLLVLGKMRQIRHPSGISMDDVEDSGVRESASSCTSRSALLTFLVPPISNCKEYL